jgi:hypothetical protein
VFDVWRCWVGNSGAIRIYVEAVMFVAWGFLIMSV